MNQEQINALIKDVKIYLKKTGEPVDYQQLSAKKLSHKYSSTHTPIWRLEIDGTSLGRNNPYRVGYKCLECNRENLVNLELFVRKMNQNIVKCRQCKELDAAKRENQSRKMQERYHSDNVSKAIEKPVVEKYTNAKLISESEAAFNEMDSDFQDRYFMKHLTTEEFELLRDKIVSFGKGKYKIGEFTYHPTVKCFNHCVFNPRVYNQTLDLLEKIEYLEFACEICSTKFVSRDLYNQKNNYKILCQYCRLCRDTFKIRRYENYLKENVTYQSQLELKFIRFCNENAVIVRDGPRVNYHWGDKSRIYRVDFYLPQLGWLVELKDDHIWHKNEVASGKWQAKESAAIELVNNTDEYQAFVLVFSKQYQVFLTRLKQALNSDKI